MLVRRYLIKEATSRHDRPILKSQLSFHHSNISEEDSDNMGKPMDGKPQTIMVIGQDGKPVDVTTTVVRSQTQLDAMNASHLALSKDIKSWKTQSDEEMQTLKDGIQAHKDEMQAHKGNVQAIRDEVQALNDKHEKHMDVLELLADKLLKLEFIAGYLARPRTE